MTWGVWRNAGTYFSWIMLFPWRQFFGLSINDELHATFEAPLLTFSIFISNPLETWYRNNWAKNTEQNYSNLSSNASRIFRSNKAFSLDSIKVTQNVNRVWLCVLFAFYRAIISGRCDCDGTVSTWRQSHDFAHNARTCHFISFIS